MIKTCFLTHIHSSLDTNLLDIQETEVDTNTLMKMFRTAISINLNYLNNCYDFRLKECFLNYTDKIFYNWSVLMIAL